MTDRGEEERTKGVEVFSLPPGWHDASILIDFFSAPPKREQEKILISFTTTHPLFFLRRRPAFRVGALL
jgi:hypothetical protein